MMIRTFVLMLIGYLALAMPPVMANPLPNPTGPVILSVSGAIENRNGPDGADFDRAMLSSLPQHEFITATPWTEGRHRYRGVLLSSLLEYVGANGQQLVARGLNDYHAVIDRRVIEDYPALLALTVDGRPMRVRDKGPIWILFPLSDFPELDTITYHASMVWQLRRIEVE